MWVKTKKEVIYVNNAWIDELSCCIYANNGDFKLGSYENIEKCKKAFNDLCDAIKYKNHFFEMPEK